MQEAEFGLTVNGKPRRVKVRADLTLLQLLRDVLGLTGTKEGCGTGECGACTVIMDGEAVPSCLVLAVQARGKSIVTVEGLADTAPAHAGQPASGSPVADSPGPAGTSGSGRFCLHPLQESFGEHGAVQCGYCTPGMLMSAKALLDKNPRPERAAIEEAIAGNLCRCTGYYQIVEAIEDAAARLASRGEGGAGHAS